MQSAAIERGLPGLAVLSSAQAAIRYHDGLCGWHDRYVRATAVCAAFAPAVAEPSRQGPPVFTSAADRG